LDWSCPYPSGRSPVLGERVVATSQPLAAEAGIAAMRRGGNAVDAAIATAITLTVVEPNNNGLGSDAFALLWDGSALHGLNASGRSPRAWQPERFADHQRMPSLGWDAVTVPGAVSAWTALSERFGALPFADLFADAIRYAHDGFPVGPETGAYWQEVPEIYAGHTEFLTHFCPEGRPPAIGERFRSPDLASSLTAIAETRGESFYRGALAQRIARHAREAHGALDEQDLAHHAPEWVAPLGVEFAETRVHEIPPNTQSLGALVALGILERLPLRAHGPDDAGCLHLQIEAMKLGIADAFTHVADPDALTVAPAALLAPERLDTLAARVDPARAEPLAGAPPTSPDTVYLTTGDAEGRMVSFIQSNYFMFGAGVVVPGTGISLQNRGAGFTLEAGHPNCVGPAKRPFHTLMPGFATRAGQPWLSFGVMGAHMQHQGHVQMMVRLAHFGQNPQAACDAPRWHVYPDGRVGVEAGIADATLDALRTLGHDAFREHRKRIFGGAQLLLRLDGGGYAAGSDHRKEGQAAAW